MSASYADAYLKFHEDLGLLRLDDKEMASLSAIALFSTGEIRGKCYNNLVTTCLSFGSQLN